MTFRDRLRAATPQAPAIGTWVKLPCIETIELAALGGVDFVAIDAEHAAFDPSMIAQQIALSRALGVTPVVRLPRTATHEVTRVLDAGADAIIFPRIDTGADARFGADQLHFEPEGRRGNGISSRAGAWGLRGADAYIDASHAPAAIAMIESRAGSDAIEEIVTNGGVDAVLIGPADLTLALGHGAATGHPDVRAAIERVAAAAQAAGKVCGIAVGGAADVARLAPLGFRFYLVSNDATLLGRAYADAVHACRSLNAAPAMEAGPAQ